MSIIINALRQGHTELALALIQHAKPYQVSQYDSQGQTALHLAIQKNYMDAAKALLEKGANINALATDLSYTHMTPLHYAALTGNIKATQLLLSWGANIHLENGQFHTAATMAYQHGFLEVARLIEQRHRHNVKYQWPAHKPQPVGNNTIDSLQTRPINNVVDFATYRKKNMGKS